MGENEFTRRQLIAAMSSAVLPATAQVRSSREASSSGRLLDEARSEVRARSKQLATFPIEMLTEPAVIFKP